MRTQKTVSTRPGEVSGGAGPTHGGPPASSPQPAALGESTLLLLEPGSVRCLRQPKQTDMFLPASCPKHLLGSRFRPLQSLCKGDLPGPPLAGHTRPLARSMFPKPQLFLHWNGSPQTVEPSAWQALRGSTDGDSTPREGPQHSPRGAPVPGHRGPPPGLTLGYRRPKILRDFKERPRKLLLHRAPQILQAVLPLGSPPRSRYGPHTMNILTKVLPHFTASN